MRHIFRVLVVACLLAVTFNVFADDNPHTNEPTMADPKEVLKLFDNPSSQFSPRKEILFISYLFNLDNYPESKSFEIQRVFRTAINFYQKKYQATQDFYKQEKILGDMQDLLLKALASKNISRTKLYTDFDQYLFQLYQIRDAMNRGEIPMPGAKEFTIHTDAISLEKILDMKVERAIAKLDNGSEKVHEILFKDATFEISLEALPIQKSVGNISYLAPKSERKKAYKIKIIEPSENVGEATAMISHALLSNDKVSGLLFEDKMHIPSKLDANSYELFSYGSRVMLKKSPPLCSRLFM